MSADVVFVGLLVSVCITDGFERVQFSWFRLGTGGSDFNGMFTGVSVAKLCAPLLRLYFLYVRLLRG